MSTLNSHESEFLIDRLIRVVERLAWPADRQRDYLADLGVAPSLDELALEFDDALTPARDFYLELNIADRAQEALNAIDLILAELTEQPGLEDSAWNLDALESDSRWLDIRRLAQTAHAELRRQV